MKLETIRKCIAGMIADESRLGGQYHEGRASALRFCLGLLDELDTGHTENLDSQYVEEASDEDS